MCPLTHCCYCISLRTGTFIVAFLNLLGSIASVGGLVVANFLVLSHGHASTTFISQRGLEIELSFIALLFLCCLQIAFDILLFVGANRRRSGYIVPWIVMKILVLALCTIGSVAYFIRMHDHVDWVNLVVVFVAYFTHLAVSTYMLVVVCSFYISVKNLPRDDRRPLTEKTRRRPVHDLDLDLDFF